MSVAVYLINELLSTPNSTVYITQELEAELMDNPKYGVRFSMFHYGTIFHSKYYIVKNPNCDDRTHLHPPYRIFKHD